MVSSSLLKVWNTVELITYRQPSRRFFGTIELYRLHIRRDTTLCLGHVSRKLEIRNMLDGFMKHSVPDREKRFSERPLKALHVYKILV